MSEGETMSYFFFLLPWTNIVMGKTRQGQGLSPPIIAVTIVGLGNMPHPF
jgi:hypothetical protein